jgi:hypothetical protein
MTRFYVGRLGDEGDHSVPYARQNDGALTIMAAGEPLAAADEARPLLLVPRFAHVPRAKAYSAADPAQEAFAETLARLLAEADARGEFRR